MELHVTGHVQAETRQGVMWKGSCSREEIWMWKWWEWGRWDIGSLKYSGHRNRYAGLEYPSGIPNLMASTLHCGMLSDD